MWCLPSETIFSLLWLNTGENSKSICSHGALSCSLLVWLQSLHLLHSSFVLHHMNEQTHTILISTTRKHRGKNVIYWCKPSQGIFQVLFHLIHSTALSRVHYLYKRLNTGSTKLNDTFKKAKLVKLGTRNSSHSHVVMTERIKLQNNIVRMNFYLLNYNSSVSGGKWLISCSALTLCAKCWQGGNSGKLFVKF